MKVHPSPTASTGRSIKQSTSIKPGDPSERRIECAQCGWPVNLDQHAMGNTGGDGATGGVQFQDVSHSFTNTEAKLPIGLRGISTFTASSRTVTEPVVSSGTGCPFCGSTNSAGHLRGDDASWGRINLEGQ